MISYSYRITEDEFRKCYASPHCWFWRCSNEIPERLNDLLKGVQLINRLVFWGLLKGLPCILPVLLPVLVHSPSPSNASAGAVHSTAVCGFPHFQNQPFCLTVVPHRLHLVSFLSSEVLSDSKLLGSDNPTFSLHALILREGASFRHYILQ